MGPAVTLDLAQALGDLIAATRNPDWVLMVRDTPAPAYLRELIDGCVFNPGVAYVSDKPGEVFRFFNLRASSLQAGGDLFDIGAGYPPHKRVTLNASRPDDYRLNPDQHAKGSNSLFLDGHALHVAKEKLEGLDIWKDGVLAR